MEKTYIDLSQFALATTLDWPSIEVHITRNQVCVCVCVCVCMCMCMLCVCVCVCVRVRVCVCVCTQLEPFKIGYGAGCTVELVEAIDLVQKQFEFCFCKSQLCQLDGQRCTMPNMCGQLHFPAVCNQSPTQLHLNVDMDTASESDSKCDSPIRVSVSPARLLGQLGERGGDGARESLPTTHSRSVSVASEFKSPHPMPSRRLVESLSPMSRGMMMCRELEKTGELEYGKHVVRSADEQLNRDLAGLSLINMVRGKKRDRGGDGYSAEY